MNSDFAKFLQESDYLKDKIIYHNDTDEINFEATLLSHDAMKKLVNNHWEDLLCNLIRSLPYIYKSYCVIYLESHI